MSDFVTISCGTNTQIPLPENNLIEFIENTDQALYLAKKSGRNCVRHYRVEK